MSQTVARSACQEDDVHSWLHASDGFNDSSTWGQRSLSLHDGSSQVDWQVPRAPVRFPLRDALLSFQDSSKASSVQEAEAKSSTISASKGPLVVQMTAAAKLRKHNGHRKRHGLDPVPLGEIPPSSFPRPPPEVTSRAPPRKHMKTMATTSQVQDRRRAENAAWATWLADMPHSESAPELQTAQQVIRGTLTSSARAVLAHSRRFAHASPMHASTHSLPATMSGGSHGSASATGKVVSGKKTVAHQDPLIHLSASRVSSGLPKPVREWVCRGLEFTDAGLGIGDRFEVDITQRAARAPGSIYDTDFGNVARWKTEASQPTKQPDSRHGSTETHKMGARRDISGKRDKQRPGPGTYEHMGFAQELMYNLAKRPKGEAPRPLSPPSSLDNSKKLEESIASWNGEMMPCLRYRDSGSPRFQPLSPGGSDFRHSPASKASARQQEEDEERPDS